MRTYLSGLYYGGGHGITVEIETASATPTAS
ncbi:hypothetical protein TPAU25S_00910 [Tsukamurella paurometabola]